MYLQLTTRCNMTCDHCCMNATHRGKDMPRKVYDAAFRLCREWDMNITLGGGEPTLHPEFDAIFGQALMSAGEGGVFMATNGTDEEKTLRLLSMNAGELFRVEVSLDVYHDYDLVSESVRALARKNKMVRDVSGRVLARGRGKNLSSVDECACSEIFVDPSGNVWGCGCKTHKLGNVLDPDFHLESEWLCNECWDSEYHQRHEMQHLCK